MQRERLKFGKQVRQAQSTMQVAHFLTTSQNLKARPAPLRYDVHNAVVHDNFAHIQRHNSVPTIKSYTLKIAVHYELL